MYLQSVCSYHAQHRLKQLVKNTKSHRLETDIKKILVEYWEKKLFWQQSKRTHLAQRLAQRRTTKPPLLGGRAPLWCSLTWGDRVGSWSPH